MKRALVCGAGGFIGGHLVKKLKKEGYWVRGVDLKEHEFTPTQADEFLLLDLREEKNCQSALKLNGDGFDEVYQLAADMGGMGFIHSAECEIMHNSALINIHMIHTSAEIGIPRYFFSSSVCVYRNMKAGEAEMSEDEAIPAHPDNEYGWEKLYGLWPQVWDEGKNCPFSELLWPAGNLEGREGKSPSGDLPQGG
jgi:nucleoside-diphosphate-sugar epimerase